jgi:excinuclease ABC subunit A
VQIDAHSFKEIDTPEFWDFVDRAVEGFASFTERLEQSPDDVMPWKKLGQKWHLSRKGFPPGKQPAWEQEVLEELIELLNETAAEGEFLWSNQQVVHLMLPQQREPWATVYTKRLEGVDLALRGPKDEFALGRIAGLGAVQEVATDRRDRDSIKLRFVRPDELARSELAAFLEEHCNAVRSSAAVS